MDFPCKLKNCTQAVVNQYHHVDDWSVSVKSVDFERQMTNDLLSVLAILKSMWSLTFIGCTRKCSYAVAWLVFMEVIQALCFAMELVDWPKFFLHHPRNAEDLKAWMDVDCDASFLITAWMDVDCDASFLITALLSGITLVQCIDEALMVRKEQKRCMACAIFQALPMLVILVAWWVWLSLDEDDGYDYRAVPILSLFISLMCFCSACGWSWAALHRAKNGVPCAACCGPSDAEPR